MSENLQDNVREEVRKLLDQGWRLIPKNASFDCFTNNLSGHSAKKRVDFGATSFQCLQDNTRDKKELQFPKMDDPQDYQDLDYPNHVEILSSQDRVKNRLLQEGPFSVVLFRQDFTQMEPIHMADMLRCPEILGNRENYGIPRRIGTDRARRRERTTARGVEISRFWGLSDHGRVEPVFKACYPEQWQNTKII
jgi:hypothetical protein